MNYHEAVIIDFARRTRANLEFIEAAKGRGENVFEVTQLANSLLGLLVFPQQRYMSSIPDTPLSDLVSQGWPKIRTTAGALPEENLQQLLRMLRNSIAHCNVEFISETEGQITGIKVWNINNSGKKTWQAELSLDDLRTIVLKFIELIESDKVSG
jgi:HEPN pEK499 p136